MAAAFQQSGFQNNAFQIGATPAPLIDTHDGATIKKHRERLKKQSALAHDAIYRIPEKRPVLKLAADVLPDIPKIETPGFSAADVEKFIAEIELAKQIQDDEEAIIWLLQ